MKLKITFLMILFTSLSSFAQLEGILGTMTNKDVESYTTPLATTVGTALNSGAYSSAHIPKKFGLSIAFNAIYVMIPDEQRTYQPSSLDTAKGYNNTTKVSTIFGPTGSKIFTGGDGMAAFPGGFNLAHATFVLPQISLHAYHTELLVRYFPGIKIVDKKFNLLGLGVRHSFGQYFNLPVDVSIHGFYNSFKVDELVSSTNTAFGIAVSKTFGMLTPYGGIQMESSDMKFNYEKTELGKEIKVNTEVKGENKLRLTIGAEFRYELIALHLDYNLGNQGTAIAGITLKF